MIRRLLGALALMLAAAPAAQAATISVPPGTADTNATCSASPCPNLRAAIAYANANPGTTISLAAGTYALSIDELKLTADATIIGQGAAQTKIQQTGSGFRVLEIPGSVSGAPTVTLQNNASTLTGNTSSGGLGSGGASGGGNIDVSGGTLYLEDSIVSGGTVAPGPSSSGGNCRTENGGTITDQTHNLEDTTPSQCGLSSANHDVIGVDPLLGPLADNGGPTQTRALGPGSPAIGAGECFASSDQRGQPRPSGGPCDIGAYETRPGGGGTPGGGTPGGGPPGGGTPAPGSPKLPGQQPVVSADGSVKVIVACAGAGAGAGACTGTLQLTVTKLGSAYSARAGHRAGPQVVVIGSTRFRIAAGHSAAVSARLSSLGRRLLRAHPHGLAVTGRISISGSKATVTRQLTLKPAHARRRRR